MSSSLIRQDLVPMIVGYVLIMGALAIGLRLVRRSARAEAAEAAGAAPATDLDRPAGREVGPVRARLRAIARPEPGWRRLAIHSLGTAVGGYLVLMAVIVAYYYGVGVRGSAGSFVPSAFSGCAMLLGLAAPVFIALSWLAARKGWRI